MKELTLEEMKEINGGAWYNYVDSACAGVGLAMAYAWYAAIAVAPVAGGISAGCAIWAAYRVLV